MGRLFWKFFLAFWLTLIVVAIIVGSGVRLRHNSTHHNHIEDYRLDHRAGIFITPAASIAEQSDIETLKRYLQDIDKSRGPTLYAVDAKNKDILGRDVERAILVEAKKQFELGHHQNTIRQVTTPLNQNLFLFAVVPEHSTARCKSNKQIPKASHGSAGPRGPFNGKPGRPSGFIGLPVDLLLLITVGIIASLFFSGILAWYFTKPIRHLRNAFTAVSTGKLDTRISAAMVHRKDELSELGINFDDMVSKLQNLITGQQQLLHDVSHELRSPLARMQAAIGIAQQQPEKRQETFSRLERETQRISDLIGELLMLSQVENTDNLQAKQAIDFAELMAEIIEDTRYEADEKNITINFTSGTAFSLMGFEELLRRAIENIIRNAIKFSPPGSTIFVNVKQFDQYVTLTVADQGPGVAGENLLNIFQPFFRTKHQNNESSGLGLAIALRAIEKHNGVITATNQDDGKGLIVTINLPL